MGNKDRNQEIAEVYRSLFIQHGASAHGVRWDDEFQQMVRLKILLEIADISNTKILDFGCGYGQMLNYLKQQNINVDYTGIDLVDEYLEFGRENYPEARFCQQQDIENETFDYIFLSGLFTADRGDDCRKFWQDTIRWCFSRASKGIAFNMWSKYAEFHMEKRYYEDPGEVFRFVKQLDIRCNLTIRNDYITPQDRFSPHDFTVYLQK